MKSIVEGKEDGKGKPLSWCEKWLHEQFKPGLDEDLTGGNQSK